MTRSADTTTAGQSAGSFTSTFFTSSWTPRSRTSSSYRSTFLFLLRRPSSTFAYSWRKSSLGSTAADVDQAVVQEWCALFLFGTFPPLSLWITQTREQSTRDYDVHAVNSTSTGWTPGTAKSVESGCATLEGRQRTVFYSGIHTTHKYLPKRWDARLLFTLTLTTILYYVSYMLFHFMFTVYWCYSAY